MILPSNFPKRIAFKAMRERSDVLTPRRALQPSLGGIALSRLPQCQVRVEIAARHSFQAPASRDQSVRPISHRCEPRSDLRGNR